MTRFNCYVMCLALISSLAGCYASVEPEHPRHARREHREHREVVVREVHYEHRH